MVGTRRAAKYKQVSKAEGQGAGIGTVRRMMDHHACPKTRWDSAEMKNVDRRRENRGREKGGERERERTQPAARRRSDISDHEV